MKKHQVSDETLTKAIAFLTTIREDPWAWARNHRNVPPLEIMNGVIANIQGWNDQELVENRHSLLHDVFAVKNSDFFVRPEPERMPSVERQEDENMKRYMDRMFDGSFHEFLLDGLSWEDLKSETCGGRRGCRGDCAVQNTRLCIWDRETGVHRPVPCVSNRTKKLPLFEVVQYHHVSGMKASLLLGFLKSITRYQKDDSKIVIQPQQML